MTTDLMLFELPEPSAPLPVCRTCGATCPADHPKPAAWLEPVSRECLDCNHRTVAEVLAAYRAGDSRSMIAAYRRHLDDPAWMPKRQSRERR